MCVVVGIYNDLSLISLFVYKIVYKIFERRPVGEGVAICNICNICSPFFTHCCSAVSHQPIFSFDTYCCNKTSTTRYQLCRLETKGAGVQHKWPKLGQQQQQQTCVTMWWKARFVTRCVHINLAQSSPCFCHRDTHIYITQSLLAGTESTAGKRPTSVVINIFTSFQEI